ncbi:hypothetical protein OC861_005461 [Tilletia horrida]|nr:hypothetical protein OC861_005461 [Tilletia horrida]
MTDKANRAAVHAKRVAFFRQVSVPSLEARAPPLTHRWLHTSGNGKDWSAFGATDSNALENAWQRIKDDEELRQEIEDATADRSQSGSQNTSGQSSPTKKESQSEPEKKADPKADPNPKPVELKMDPPDPFTPLPPWRVPVGEDHLYEVDLRTHKLFPVFWKQEKGSTVMRGTWFTESNNLSPIATDLAEELEEYYHDLQPWLPSYADELKSAVTIGSDAEDKLKRPLKNTNGYVIMLGPHLARIYTQDLTTRLAKSLLTAWSGEHSGGQLVIRGFETAKRSLQVNKDNKDDSKVSKSRSTDDLKRRLSKSSSSLAQRFQPGSGSSTPAQGESAREHDSDPSTPVKTGETSASVELLRSISAKLGQQASKVAAEVPAKERQAALSGMLSSGLEDKAKKDDEDDDEDDGRTKTAGAEMSEENEEDELEREEVEAQQPVDLVLILHGIGQKYAADTQPSLDFTIAVNSFRELVHKQAKQTPPATVGGGGFPQMLNGRRIQFLPVMWRAALEDFEPEPAHEPDDHLDNHFKIDDVFGDRNSIPIVRKLISGVLLDIPLYLSRHRGEIVRRVVGEANKMYRLFCQRNPDFESRGGRTHWIAHSLGAALAFDILSAQPTYVPPLKEIDPASTQLHYNVSTLILAGSPTALFIWLAKSQVIARKGRQGPSADDDCTDKNGEYLGCLAVDRIANIYSLSDPVGTRLTPCVANEYASTLKMVSLTDATTAVLRSLPGGLDTPLPTNSGFFSSWGRSSVVSTASRNSDENADMAEDLFGKGKSKNDGSNNGNGNSNEDRSSGWFARISARRGGNQKRPSSAGSTSTVGPDDWERVRRTSTLGEKPNLKADGQGEKRDGKEKKDKEGETKEKEEEEDKDGADGESKKVPGDISMDRGRRRVNALNQLGTLDFTIPIASSILSNQYLDMLYSHASYWHLPSFADAVLAFCFASDETLAAARKHLFKGSL